MRGRPASSMSGHTVRTQHCANRRTWPLPTAIVNPKQPKETPKSFSFDYSYWSHTSVSRAGPGGRWDEAVWTPLSTPRGPLPSPSAPPLLQGPVGGGEGAGARLTSGGCFPKSRCAWEAALTWLTRSIRAEAGTKVSPAPCGHPPESKRCVRLPTNVPVPWPHHTHTSAAGPGPPGVAPAHLNLHFPGDPGNRPLPPPSAVRTQPSPSPTV